MRRAPRVRNYIAVFADPEGVTYRYVMYGSRRQDVEKEARESAGRSGATFVAVELAVDPRSATRRRQLILAAVTVTLAGIMITGLVIAGDNVSSVL